MKTENTQHLQDKAEVLIALAAQQSETVEESPSPEELADFFANSRRFSKDRQEQILAYLDSNPQAYERWIKQGKSAEQPRGASFKLLMTPYAIAIYTLLLIIGAGLLWRGQAFELDQAINKSYQVAAFDGDPENFRQAMMSLNAAMQQTTRPLSFSQSGKSSDLAKAFSIGLQQDWQAFDGEAVESSVRLVNAKQEDYQLGRWHTLLWMVSQQNRVMSTNFWQVQLKVLDHLRTHYTGSEEAVDTTEVRAVVLQLERMQPVLQQLVEDSQAVKSYRQLEKILSALRYILIP